MKGKCRTHGIKTSEVGRQNLIINGITFTPFMIGCDCPQCKKEELVPILLNLQEKGVVETTNNKIKVNWGTYSNLSYDKKRVAAYFLLDAGILTHEERGNFILTDSGRNIDPGIGAGVPVYFTDEKDALNFKSAAYSEKHHIKIERK